MTRPAEVTVKPGLVQFLIYITPELKQSLADLQYEDHMTFRAMGTEALEDYVAKRRGTISARQAVKQAAIEQALSEERERQRTEAQDRHSGPAGRSAIEEMGFDDPAPPFGGVERL